MEDQPEQPPTVKDLVRRSEERRERDAERYESLDSDRCQLCHAYGADKRTLLIYCFYAIHEVVPEAIDLTETEHDFDGYLVRICKQCRGDLLDRLHRWRDDRVAMRDLEKDHDGRPVEGRGRIPVRVNGRTVMMTEAEYEAHDRADPGPEGRGR